MKLKKIVFIASSVSALSLVTMSSIVSCAKKEEKQQLTKEQAIKKNNEIAQKVTTSTQDFSKLFAELGQEGTENVTKEKANQIKSTIDDLIEIYNWVESQDLEQIKEQLNEEQKAGYDQVMKMFKGFKEIVQTFSNEINKLINEWEDGLETKNLTEITNKLSAQMQEMLANPI